MSDQTSQGRGCYINCELRFGIVPVGTTVVKTYPLKNKHHETVSFSITRNSETNPIYYVFDIDTYEVTLDPDEQCILKISYTPNIPRSKDFDYFTIAESLGHLHRLSFTGECTGPLVQASIRNLTFFETPKRKVVKQVFTLTNTSKVHALYQFDCVAEEQGVFKVEPTKGTLKPEEHQYVTVTFIPKFARFYSRQLCCLILHHEPILFNLCGVCANSGTYESFRHHPWPFEDTVSYKGYFRDSVTMTYVPPPVSLTVNYLDFGRIMPEGSCQILTSSFTNHLSNEVEVEWETIEEFRPYPEKLKIPPGQSALYEFKFCPKDSCKLSGGIVNGQVSWSTSDREIPGTFNVPIPITLRLIGHSFPKNESWIPSITVIPQNVILPLTLPTTPTWTTFMIRTHGHLPVMYKLLPPHKTNFIMKPMVGLIRQHQIIAVQLETYSIEPRSYVEQWSIELNGQVHSSVKIYVKAHTDVPRAQVANGHNCIRFDPMHPGTQGCVYVPIKNVSYSKLQYEFFVKGSFDVNPRKGVLAANEEIFVTASYTSDLRDEPLKEFEVICGLQCITLEDTFIGETIDIPVTVSVEIAHTELCALPQSYQCGEIESGTGINTCFYLYNFGKAVINFKLVHNHDLKDVNLSPVCAKCGPREKLMVKVDFTPRIVGNIPLIISYHNRLNQYTEKLTEEAAKGVFTIEHQCTIPTFQILDLLEHNFRLLSNRDIWELLKIDEINAALLEVNPGEIKRVDLCLPENERSDELFYVVFAIKNVSNISTNLILKRRQVCDCKLQESDDSLTFRVKTFDCVHKKLLTIEMSSFIMPKNSMKPLFFKIKYLLSDKNILSYVMQLTHNRTIVLDVAIYGIPEDSYVLSVLGEDFTLNMGFVYIGLREAPIFAYWLYNNTQRPVGFKVDDVEIVKLCNFDGFPVLKCLNCVGFVQPHSSAPLLFKFWPIEIKTYEVSVPVQLGDREGTLNIVGYGTDEKNKFDFKTLKSVETRPLRNRIMNLSINHLILPPLLLSNSIDRMFFITNSSKVDRMQYSWRSCFVDGLIKIEPSEVSGILKPEESRPVVIKITSLSEPCSMKILLFLDFVNLEELTEHQNKMPQQRGGSSMESTIAGDEEKVEEVIMDEDIMEPPQTFCIALPITVNVVGILDRDNCIYAEDQMKQRPWEGVHADVNKFLNEYSEKNRAKERCIHPQPETGPQENEVVDEPIIDKEMMQGILEYIVSDAVFSEYFKEILKSEETEPSPLYSQIKFNKRQREKLREKETRKFLTQAHLPDVANACEEAILESLQKVFHVEPIKRRNSKEDHLL